jgi:tRNA(fMet)-specific endonuclease VapC
MTYLLDTNIAIHARDGMERVLQKLEANDGIVLLSSLSLAELQRGLYKDGAHAALRRARLEILLRHIDVIPFDEAAARAYGEIIAQCGWLRGKDFDRMIAAHAISSMSVLVTNNVTDFRGIPGLVIENWTDAE